MRSTALSFLLFTAAMMNGSSSLRQLMGHGLSPAVYEAWREDIRFMHLFPRRLDRIELPMARSRELARLNPRHSLTVKTYEISAYILHQQQRLPEATQAFVLTKRLALAAGDMQTAAVADNALSNIYLVAGNIPGALEAARQAVGSVPDSSAPKVKVTFQIQFARMLARNGRFDEAVTVFTRAIETAESEQLPALRADAWKLVGHELALRGELGPAQRAVSEALRLRHLQGDPEMASDYHDLADIRLRAGQPAEAQHILDLAGKRILTATRFMPWRLDLLRGRARLALGESRRALDDLRHAIRGIDASPSYMLPGDMLRSQIARPTEAHEYFAVAALSEFDRTGDRALLREAFAVSEAGRAAALRLASTSTAIPRALAHRYWNIVADLDEANARLLVKDDVDARRRIGQLRLALAEVESGFDQGFPTAISRLDLPPPLALLHENEAVVTFQLGERLSLAWSLAAGRLEVARLPPRAVVQRQIQDWLDAAPGPEKESRAHELNRTLVGKLPPAVHAAKSWLVAADGELFHAPLAALVTAIKSGRPVYLAETYALQLIPGAWALERRQAALHTGRFIGVGDPIYNEADPRRGFRFSWQSRSGDGLELSRLAGSAVEIENCARMWPSAALLMGAQAVSEEFSRELGRSPAAVHLAIHVVPAPDVPSENLMVLGGGPNGRPAYLGPEWVGAHRLPGGSLVVMNGCRSGSGAVSAGEGLMGLTRAWLRAGAGRVLSTYWPTLDDGGALATEFYRQLTRERVSTAEALRRAQVAMIGQTDWRADPRYWAAYFLIGYPE
jgi:CHAT domain-containing protein